MTAEETSEIRLRRRIGKQMRDAVGAVGDGLSRMVLRRNVNHGQLAPFMGCGDGSSEFFSRKFRKRDVAKVTVFINDLDVVAAFGDAFVHELLGIGGTRQGRAGTPYSVP